MTRTLLLVQSEGREDREGSDGASEKTTRGKRRVDGSKGKGPKATQTRERVTKAGRAAD